MKYLAVILIILFAGCSVEKQVFRARKIIEKHPHTLDPYMTIRDSMVYNDTTIYRDTTLYDTIQGETKIDSFFIESPPTRIKPLRIEMEHVTADIWVENGQVYAKIDFPPMVREWRLDSVIAERDRYLELYQTEIFRPPPVQKPIPWYYKAALWGFIGMIFLLIVLIVILKLLKKIPKL